MCVMGDNIVRGDLTWPHHLHLTPVFSFFFQIYEIGESDEILTT